MINNFIDLEKLIIKSGKDMITCHEYSVDQPLCLSCSFFAEIFPKLITRNWKTSAALNFGPYLFASVRNKDYKNRVLQLKTPLCFPYWPWYWKKENDRERTKHLGIREQEDENTIKVKDKNIIFPTIDYPNSLMINHAFGQSWNNPESKKYLLLITHEYGPEISLRPACNLVEVFKFKVKNALVFFNVTASLTRCLVIVSS